MAIDPDIGALPKAPRGGKGVMDFRTAPGLASGLKRIGGRNGISRLGKVGKATADANKHGRLRISHKY